MDDSNNCSVHIFIHTSYIKRFNFTLIFINYSTILILFSTDDSVAATRDAAKWNSLVFSGTSHCLLFALTRAKKKEKKIRNKQCFFKIKESWIQLRSRTIKDKRHVHVTQAWTSLLANEIKWQLLNEEERERQREKERHRAGGREAGSLQGRSGERDFVQPGNWSHHKQIEFRSFWWARADQSIWCTTQWLSASQKDTLASNKSGTVNKRSPGFS